MKIKTQLHHFFVPHQGNDYKPHLFREIALVSIVGVSFFINKTVLGASIASTVLIDLTNENRLANNEAPLVKSILLEQAAALKGNDMVSREYFAHNSPDGKTPWYWFRKVGYTFLYAGENLAVNFSESEDVVTGWLNSPSHKANLLNTKFKEIGIATVEGVYEGNPTVFVVQMFGSPATVVKTSTETSSSTGKAAALSASTSSQELTGSSLALGEVKGVGTEKPKEEGFMFIHNNFIAIKTDEATHVNSPVNESIAIYSSWYERIIFGGSRYIDYFYRFLAIFLGVALFTMFIVEIKRQHWRHISYGLFVILIILGCLYINTLFT
jgi:hypothetical protein